MKLSALEQKRLAMVSEDARKAIHALDIKGDRLYVKGTDESIAAANKLYKESDRLYSEQVLHMQEIRNRKFNNNKEHRKLSYDCTSKEVTVDAVKSDCCDGYNLIECIVESGNEPMIISGPYLTKKAALLAGEKYVSLITGE